VITQERLKEVLDYNPETGIFTWNKTLPNGISAGAKAGGVDSHGYIQIKVCGVAYLASRLAILYTDGYWPENTVDHGNRVRTDNRRINLREASHRCQARNRSTSIGNVCGVKGIRWRVDRGRWEARIAINRCHEHLGYYDNLLDAAYARYAAEQCLGFQDCDTNSSAKKYIIKQGGVC